LEFNFRNNAVNWHEIFERYFRPVRAGAVTLPEQAAALGTWISRLPSLSGREKEHIARADFLQEFLRIIFA
jgi:hypothetical protein